MSCIQSNFIQKEQGASNSAYSQILLEHVVLIEQNAILRLFYIQGESTVKKKHNMTEILTPLLFYLAKNGLYIKQVSCWKVLKLLP